MKTLNTTQKLIAITLLTVFALALTLAFFNIGGFNLTQISK